MEQNKTKYFRFSLIFLILAAFSHGLGVGAGAVFFLATILNKEIQKKIFGLKAAVIYLIVGAVTYLTGPLVYRDLTRHILPAVTNPIKDIVLYTAFVIAGVARGVVGRFFLPGFEPRHFDLIPTLFSFLPSVIIFSLIVILLRKKLDKKIKLLLTTTCLFIIYPYIWAGFLRFQFGLKQALAERYAYPSLFFFSLLLAQLIKNCSYKKFTSRLLLLFITVILVTFQTIFFIRNAIIFEVKPGLTQKYFEKLAYVLENSSSVLDLPLPSYINQEFYLSDLAPLIIPEKFLPRFIKLDKKYCTTELKEIIKNPVILNFYYDQSKDPVVQRSFPETNLFECKSK